MTISNKMVDKNFHNPFMYIDQGLWKKIFQCRKNLELFWKEVSREGLNNENNRKGIPTSFAFLENIGLIPKPQEYKISSNDS